MQRDHVYQRVLEEAVGQAAELNAGSDVVRLVPAPGSGDPPALYRGLFTGIPHFERVEQGGVRTVRVSETPVPFAIWRRALSHTA